MSGALWQMYLVVVLEGVECPPIQQYVSEYKNFIVS
jgi:hypothetical protein